MAMYRCGGGGDITTPITPSNASPAPMNSGTGYKPTANGYAISSYDSVTPSSTPESVASGDIVKIGGSGVIVDAIPTPTSITPDNSSPVQMTTGNEYSVSRTGYAIQSYDSITPSSTPESVSSGDIVKIGGSGVIVDAIPTPTSITPSDASPAGMTANVGYKPTTNGYAIASNPTSLTPSNSSPATISSGTIYKASAGGKAVASVTDVTPSSTPTSVSADDIVHIGGSGKIVNAISDVTPSDISPVSLTSGLTYKMGGGGYAIEHSPASLTPSDSIPVSITSGTIYKAGGGGYAIESYDNVYPGETPILILKDKIYRIVVRHGYVIDTYADKTPDDTTPPSVAVGDIVRITNNSGYLYATQQGVSGFSNADKDTASAGTSKTISNASGKTLLLYVFQFSTSSNLSYNAYDSITVSGGTATMITTLMDASARTAGTFFTLKVTSNTCTITHSNNIRIIAFEATVS